MGLPVAIRQPSGNTLARALDLPSILDMLVGLVWVAVLRLFFPPQPGDPVGVLGRSFLALATLTDITLPPSVGGIWHQAMGKTTLAVQACEGMRSFSFPRDGVELLTRLSRTCLS